MTYPVCTSDTWGSISFGPGAEELTFQVACDLARYRAAEPEKPQMMKPCANVRYYCNTGCRHRVEHQQGLRCEAHNADCPACVPVPEPPVSCPPKSDNSESAPVREIDRAELQRRIDNVRPYLLGVERDGKNLPLHSLPAYGLGLLADLEALADGKARIRGTEKDLPALIREAVLYFADTCSHCDRRLDMETRVSVEDVQKWMKEQGERSRNETL